MINVKFPIKVKDLAKVVDQANINPHTMNDNKLIAEFMGRGGTFNHDKTMICTGIYPDTMALMKYHTSWDWLMPVVQKVSSLCDEPCELDNMKHSLLTGDIESVYDDVVEFIKEHN